MTHCRTLLVQCAALILRPSVAHAQPLPVLRPPRDEISQTFWEQHGWPVIIAAFLIVLFLAALLVLLTRPKRARPEPPEVWARRNLTALQGRAEDGAALMEVSRAFRRYVMFAYNLPPEELTTAELNKMLQSNSKAEATLAMAIGDFLRQCDEDKFSRQSRPSRANAASRALELLEKIESQRHETFSKQTGV
jgi:hypothetical protein